jgi:nitroreductase
MAATLARPATQSAEPAEDYDAVLRAINTRRSAAAWLPDEPERAVVEELLAAANRAPNHKLTQPWRFFVLRGEARRAYAAALAEDTIAHQRGREPAPTPAWEAQCRQTMAQNLLRAPVAVAVGCVPAGVPDLPDWEELAATAAAVQNLLLAAHARGLGGAWKSRACPLPGAVAWLKLPPHAQLVGHVLLGYADPAVPPKPKERRPHEAVTTWLCWDE